MLAIGEYFPPNVFKELNFYNVTGPKDLAYRLRTLQLVVMAAIGAYVFYRVHPLLTSRISQIPYASTIVSLVSFFVGYTLCRPAAFLVVGGNFLYEGGIDVLSGIKHKNIGSIVRGYFGVLAGYTCWDDYRSTSFCVYPSPNLLGKLFAKVANDHCQFLYVRFYK